jgi:copper chaperone NosL
MRAAVATLLALGVAACASGPPQPVAVDTLNDQCATCRMVISDPGFAAEVVAPGEEPRLYDDLQCLRDGLATAPPAGDARVFVADHRTGAWVAADRAFYVRIPDLATPMASHWVAYADEASRRADPYAAAGVALAASEVLGRAGAGAPAGNP